MYLLLPELLLLLLLALLLHESVRSLLALADDADESSSALLLLAFREAVGTTVPVDLLTAVVAAAVWLLTGELISDLSDVAVVVVAVD